MRFVPACDNIRSDVQNVYGTPNLYRTARVELQLGQDDALLLLILSLAVGVAGLAHVVGIGLEEEDLAQALVGVDARRQWRGVRDLERHKSLPLRLERGDVDDNP